MVLISHRGNINGPNPEFENSPEYINAAITCGYNVEIDLWGIKCDNNKIILSLGHDDPNYNINIQWLYERSRKLFIHAKNFLAVSFLMANKQKDFLGLRFFFHEKERYSLIANTSLVWCHDMSEVNNFSIVPLISRQDISLWENKPVFGICSDYVEKLKDLK